jgi:hypothetical protein
MGLQAKKEEIGEPSMSKRRESFRVHEQEEPVATAQTKESIATELRARKNSAVIEEVIPETAVETPMKDVEKQLGGGKREAPKAGKPKEETRKMEASVSSATKPGGAVKGKANGNSKPAAPAKPVEKPTTNKTTSRPAAISTAKTSVAPKASPKNVKVPPAPKTPTTAGQSHLRDISSRTPESKARRGPLAPNQAAKSTSQPSTTAPKTRIPPSPPQTGFVKPKPRSPTRPVKLPASLTAHTASSGSKLAAAPPTGRQSLSRASGSFPGSSSEAKARSRSPSHASMPAPTESSSTSGKPSTANKPTSRPSLGPAPTSLKKQPSRPSLPAQIAPGGDSFLSRMMRPTTSSASKTADKPEVTLPKMAQSVKKPLTKDAAPKITQAASKPNKPTAVSKPAVKEAKHVVVAPIKKQPPSHAPQQAPKEAPKHEAKPAVEPTVETAAESTVTPTGEPAVEPELKPALAAESSVPDVLEDPTESTAVDAGEVEAANVPESEVKETHVAEVEVPELEHVESVEEHNVSDTAKDIPAEYEEIVEQVPAESLIEEEAEVPALEEGIVPEAVEPLAPVDETEVVQESAVVEVEDVKAVVMPTTEVDDAEAEGAEAEGAEAEGAEDEGAEAEGAEDEGAEAEGAEDEGVPAPTTDK